jgi:uncharacterized protein
VVLKPPETRRLTLKGPAGGLQALLETPAAASAGRAAASAFAVVCHPHPLYGGTMDNKVVWTLARAFQQLGAPAIRFNFRGVGTSAGSYDDGRGETLDTLAVIDWGRRHFPTAELWLAGFSFGAAVAVRAAAVARPARLVAVAPGITRIDVSEAAAPACPWLIVQGEADDVVAPQAVRAWAHGLAPAPTLRMLPGAGHFFHGRLNELRDAVVDFMSAAAPRAKTH